VGPEPDGRSTPAFSRDRHERRDLRKTRWEDGSVLGGVHAHRRKVHAQAADDVPSDLYSLAALRFELRNIREIAQPQRLPGSPASRGMDQLSVAARVYLTQRSLQLAMRWLLPPTMQLAGGR
jgi:hypothetical protein